MEKTVFCDVTRTDYVCPKCKKGNLQFTGEHKTIKKGTAFVHFCDDCGKQTEIESKAYPIIDFVPIKQQKEKETAKV